LLSLSLTLSEKIMRIIALIALTLPLTGCYTQTHITRTVHRSDGSTETYENRSNGYNYNPNFTGHWDSHNEQNANFSGVMPMQPPPQPVSAGFSNSPLQWGAPAPQYANGTVQDRQFTVR
jgi:hypothetical protein